MYFSTLRSSVQRTANSTFLDLEHGNGPDKKRRVTDFYFQRLQNDVIAPVSHRNSSLTHAVWSKPPAPGVPPIRLTSLEGSKNGLQKPNPWATLEAKSAVEEEKKLPETVGAAVNSKSAPTTPAASRAVHQARRFYLTRHISSVLGPNPAGGIRKFKNSIRPPLATFVERQTATINQGQNSLHRDRPIDKLLDVPKDAASEGADQGGEKEPTVDTLQASKRIPTSTFIQPRPKTVRNGTSIRDDPSTWDLESDQLADELAAFALELDPEAAQRIEAEHPPPPPPPPPVAQDTLMENHPRDDDYIIETYIRVPYYDASAAVTALQSDFGILVIDEEDEDLWQKYVDSDDESDWDEEDSNGES